MHPVIARHATRPAPRYTSYPTAPQFHAGFGPADQAAALAALDPLEPVSLYVHVPFCARMCWYCGCNMKLAARYEPIAAYVDDLLAEIDLVAEHTPGLTVARLHFGGGTPTSLSPADLSRVMDRLRDRFRFAPGPELAIEIDPRTLSSAMIAEIGLQGFTRASLGVQEFDPMVQRAINRVQPADMVARASDRLREGGVRSVNFDLIYGLPFQTRGMIERTVATCAEMRPDRLALFGYAHVPWMAKNQRMIPTEALPCAEERLAQAETSAQALVTAGFEAIGIDHFARPDDSLAAAARQGRLRRNFQGYTDDDATTLLGFGATSIGRTPDAWVQSIPETGAWARAVRAGVLPVAKGFRLGVEDKARGWVIERLMCDFAVDLAEARRRFGRPADWLREAKTSLAALETEGIVSVRDEMVEITPFGAPLARIVAQAFDAYASPAGGRHAVAV